MEDTGDEGREGEATRGNVRSRKEGRRGVLGMESMLRGEERRDEVKGKVEVRTGIEGKGGKGRQMVLNVR